MAMFNGEVFNSENECDFSEYFDLLYELLGTKKIYLISNCSATPAKNADYCELFKGTKPEIFGYSYLWVLSELWKKRKVNLATCIKMTSENAAKRLGIYPQKGCLEAGSDADFVLYNPEVNTIIKTSKAKETELTGSFESIYIKGTKVAGNGFKSLRKGSYIARSSNPKRRHNNTTWI
jgi:predicted amidohydrolase